MISQLHYKDGYSIKEIPGSELTLEQLQNAIFAQLARLIADAVRQNQEIQEIETRDTIEGQKELLEANNDV